jgi:GNAT superfamily N-acetyltransferase
MEAITARLESAGVRIHSALNTNLNEVLRRIYHLSCVAFTRNFLYTELPEEAFVAQYTGLLDRIDPELVLLAEREGELLGYLFGIPDYAQAARGAAIDTFLIKTVAILPDPSLRGLGGLLVGRAHQAGHRLGFLRCIHALMHEDNVSRNISGHYARTMRRYTLYSREIGG